MSQRRVSEFAAIFTAMALAWPALADPPEDPSVAGNPQLVSACNVSAVEIEFPSSSVRLSSRAQVDLWDIAVWAKANPSRSIRLRGMTDRSGDARANAALSERRADAVKTYLTQQGVDPGKITTFGHSENALKEDTENRRAVAVVTCLVEPLALQ
jgi:outer membrane protein OmpA-like peptidoglycan-associated protein